jgi:hypothetical protein
VQVEETRWDEGLSSTINTIDEFQDRFVQAFWNRELQELIQRQFDETRLTHPDATEFLRQLDHWYNRLITLTHLRLRPSDIIANVINKLPFATRDYLNMCDYADFTEFKRKVVRIVRKSDFDSKGGRQQGTTLPVPWLRTNPERTLTRISRRLTIFPYTTQLWTKISWTMPRSRIDVL